MIEVKAQLNYRSKGTYIRTSQHRLVNRELTLQRLGSCSIMDRPSSLLALYTRPSPAFTGRAGLGQSHSRACAAPQELICHFQPLQCHICMLP